ncbi:MAG: 50S ribosomal protein L21 [Bacteriovoracaceae bacterium]|nr:50S ribosomal protein L21 [Bacteriovoracaceae bacterium]
MYGIIEVGGHQYHVRPGELMDVDLLTAKAGEDIVLDRVLLLAGDDVVVGTPTIAGAKVTARVLSHGRGDKIRVLKRRPGQYKKVRGHRQGFTALLVTQIDDGKGNVEKLDPNSKEATKFLAAKKDAPKTKKTSAKKKTVAAKE